jgi:magnesium transporter
MLGVMEPTLAPEPSSVLGTIDGLLTANVPVVRPDERVDDVREGLQGHRFDEVDDLAVCDSGVLVGLVTIERLTAATGDLLVADIMDADPPCIAPGADQEETARRMVQRRESSLAVVDESERFVGVIPPYRLLEALLERHDRDMARLGGFLHDTQSARHASEEPVAKRLWHRLPWLLVGLAGAMASALIVGSFEEKLSEQVLIAFFIPGIVYLADAVGTQTETLTVRGLSLGVPVRGVVWLEVATGALIGVILSVVFFPFAVLVWGDMEVALVVALALFAACCTASFVALVLPWAFTKRRIDPAFGSGPLATVIQDLLSILVYFGCVEVFL